MTKKNPHIGSSVDSLFEELGELEELLANTCTPEEAKIQIEAARKELAEMRRLKDINLLENMLGDLSNVDEEIKDKFKDIEIPSDFFTRVVEDGVELEVDSWGELKSSYTPEQLKSSIEFNKHWKEAEKSSHETLVLWYATMAMCIEHTRKELAEIGQQRNELQDHLEHEKLDHEVTKGYRQHAEQQLEPYKNVIESLHKCVGTVTGPTDRQKWHWDCPKIATWMEVSNGFGLRSHWCDDHYDQYVRKNKDPFRGRDFVEPDYADTVRELPETIIAGIIK